MKNKKLQKCICVILTPKLHYPIEKQVQEISIFFKMPINYILICSPTCVF